MDQLRRWTDGRRTAGGGRRRGCRATSPRPSCRAGARCILVEPEAGLRRPDDARRGRDGPEAGALSAEAAAEAARREHHRRAVTSRGLAPAAGPSPATATACRFTDGVVDVAFSSNVLEHVPDPARFLDEMVRVTRPGGIIYLSFTAWYSPWGGHETAPWHYLGGQRAARATSGATAGPRGTVFGSSLFACHVGPTLRMARAHRRRGRRGRTAPVLPGLDALAHRGPGAARARDVEPPARAASSGGHHVSLPGRVDERSEPVAAVRWTTPTADTQPHAPSRRRPRARPSPTPPRNRRWWTWLGGHHAGGVRDQARHRPRPARSAARRGRLLLPQCRQPPGRGPRLHRPLALLPDTRPRSSRSPTGPRCSSSSWP